MMKKQFYLLSIVILGLIVSFSACKKEEVEMKNSNSTGIKVETYNSTNKSVQQKILCFTDEKHYEQTISKLELLVDEHNDKFVNENDHMTDDESNLYEEQIGFNDQLPLLEFENDLGFSRSLRRVYNIEEEKWLDNEELDMKNSPDIKYPFSIYELTLLNEDKAVKIGSYYLILTDVGFIQVNNDNLEVFTQVVGGDQKALSHPDVIIGGDFSKSDDCTNWKGYNEEDPYASKRKVNRFVHFHSYPWKGTAQAKIISYKKNRRWKKYRMRLQAAVQYRFHETGCGDVIVQGYEPYKSKRTKSLSNSVARWAAYPQFRVKKDISVFGMYKYSNWHTSIALTW